MPDKFAKSVLAGHSFHLLCMGELLLGEGAKSRPQDFAVEAVLAPEVVVDSGLVDPRLGDNGADTGFLIAAIGEHPLGGFEDTFAGDVGRSRHIPWAPFSNYRLKVIDKPIIEGLRRSSGGNFTPPPIAQGYLLMSFAALSARSTVCQCASRPTRGTPCIFSPGECFG